MTLDTILGLLDDDYITRNVRWRYDMGRQTAWEHPRLILPDKAAFDDEVSRYVQRLVDIAEHTPVSRDDALSIATHVLNREVSKGLCRDGYMAAQERALHGNVLATINTITNGLRDDAIAHHIDMVYAQYVDQTSPTTIRAAAQGFVDEVGAQIADEPHYTHFWFCFPDEIRDNIALPPQRPSVRRFVAGRALR